MNNPLMELPDFRLSGLRQIVGGARRGRLLPPRHQRAQDEAESRVPGAFCVSRFSPFNTFCIILNSEYYMYIII